MALVLELLNKGADPNWADSYGWTPLHAACYNNKANVVQLLHEKKADINKQTIYDDTPLHIACWRGNMDCVKQLVSSVHCDLGRSQSYLGNIAVHYSYYALSI